jgi:DNA-binding Xre family transcriptional regulator
MYVNLLNILNERKISLKNFAQDLPCDYSSIWKFANNKTKRVEFKMLESMCKSLNIGIEELLIIDNEEKGG